MFFKCVFNCAPASSIEVLEDLDLNSGFPVLGLTVLKQRDFGTLFGSAYSQSVILIVLATLAS